MNLKSPARLPFRAVAIKNEYDVAAAFDAIEDDLIAGIIRNLKRHKAEEIATGLDWAQWQIVQLAALELYRKENERRFRKQFNAIDEAIGRIITEYRKDGRTKTEAEIAEAIRKGFKGYKPPGGVGLEFFKVNDRRINALINATRHDFKIAQISVLRQAEDEYRRIIFNAMVYQNTGAATYEKAVDMATKDFLRAGINSIVYKNGSRHSMKEYSRMALKTAGKRAYLTGEGEKRREWGISLVIMNRRTDACPKCMPFQGKVMIDDVWSGGKPDGKHMLTSAAIESGLYHPNCKDSHTTYFEGISSPPEKLSRAYIRQVEDHARADAKRNYLENQEEKYRRMAEYSLDEENRKKYRGIEKKYKKEAADM